MRRCSSEEALADDGDEGGYYLVGIIGGKDIGKRRW